MGSAVPARAAGEPVRAAPGSAVWPVSAAGGRAAVCVPSPAPLLWEGS